MLKRQAKSETRTDTFDPPRVLVIDDDPDAGRLLAKLLRRDGYEVAEVGDHQVALITLTNEPHPIAAVVASFSASGNSSCLKLLDAIRHTPDTRVNGQRIVLALDAARQVMFAWQSGADEVLLRPYPAEELVRAVGDAIERGEEERPVHRRQMIDRLRGGVAAPEVGADTPSGVPQFN